MKIIGAVFEKCLLLQVVFIQLNVNGLSFYVGYLFNSE